MKVPEVNLDFKPTHLEPQFISICLNNANIYLSLLNQKVLTKSRMVYIINIVPVNVS